MNEADARAALAVLNERIASLLRCPVREITIRFVPLIKRTEWIDGDGNMRQRETLGQCNPLTGEIIIVPSKEWRGTAVHEMVHLYSPHHSEGMVRQRTREVVLYLKMKQGRLL